MADTTIAVSQSNNTAPSVKTGAVALAANNNRNYLQIQNVGTAALFVCFGPSASSTVYHFVLQGGTGVADGKGGIYSQQSSICYQGQVSVATGATVQYTVLEL